MYLQLGMYNYLGAGLLGLFALLAVPAIQQEITGTYMGGMTTMVVHNALGEEVMFQQVHNQIVDTGENIIVNQLFANTTGVLTDGNNIGLICPMIRLGGDMNINDQNTTAIFINDDENTGSGSTQCLGDSTSTFVGTTGGGVMIVGDAGGLAFTGSDGNGNIGNGQILRGIGVFTTSSNADLSAQVLFALIDTSDVTVGQADTVNISYTFDISANGA